MGFKCNDTKDELPTPTLIHFFSQKNLAEKLSPTWIPGMLPIFLVDAFSIENFGFSWQGKHTVGTTDNTKTGYIPFR